VRKVIAEKIIEEIKRRRLQRLQAQARKQRQTVCRASDIGECAREIFYQIINWEDKPKTEPELQARFNVGNEEHKKIRRELLEDGFDVVEGEKPFEIKGRNGKIIIVGHIDGKIRMEGVRLPFEAKSLNPNLFTQINCIEDFNKYVWARKYPRQMQTYEFGENMEEGIYILSDLLGHKKYFAVQLNYDETEKILQRCEYVMDCVEKGSPPPFHKDYSICRRCWALGRVCAPDIHIKEGVEIIDDPSIELELKRREELKPSRAEYSALDKHVKDYFKNRPEVVVGDFHITGKEVVRHVKATEEKDLKSWQTKIEYLKGGDKDGSAKGQTGSGSPERVGKHRYQGGKLPDSF